MFDAEFYRKPDAGIDTVVFRALKNNHGRILPFNWNFRNMEMFWKGRPYTYWDNGEKKTAYPYELKDIFKIGYLQDVRVILHSNFFDIVVNSFNAEYDKSVYRIFIEILFVLYM